MASMIDGKLSSDPIAKLDEKGDFQRPASRLRKHPGHDEIGPDRYHLFVSYACPWAHRTLITRNLKGLQDIVSVSITDPYMGEKGWSMSSATDPEYLWEVYACADPHYSGKVTVPVFWDKKEKTIINNESSEIIRILNSSFNKFTDSSIDLYPEDLRKEINEVNDRVYNHVNNGVYKTGFAGTQKAYEEAFVKLFETLEELEILLSRKPFLTGDYFTEADVRLFTTLIRFDPVYYVHFKCNQNRIKDYKNLYSYMKCIYQMDEVKSTCHFDHIKEHYYLSHPWLNPGKIIPKGPELDLESPHGRGPVRFWTQ